MNAAAGNAMKLSVLKLATGPNAYVIGHARIAAPGIEVIVLGGRLRHPNEAFLGAEAERALRRYQPDLAFLGADGLDPERGLNCPSPDQASMKELMATAARRAWVLADHSKLSTSPFAYWALMAPHTGLVTDPKCPYGTLQAFAERGWDTSKD